jgi:polyhydroxyalkanoate synthesis repressor PhaR
MRIVRKYENRRLYDTSASKYVNSEDLVALVRAGDELRVEDVKTGRDLTRETLLQLIVEHGAGGDLLSVPLLRRIIRASDDRPMQRALRGMLVQGLDLLHAQLDQAEAVFWRASEGGGTRDPWQSFTEAALASSGGQPGRPAPPTAEPAPHPSPEPPPSASTSARRSARRASTTSPPPAPSAAAAPPEGGASRPVEELDALRARLEALESRLRR